MNDEQRTMIEDCRNRDSRLTAWEADFLDSIEAQLDGNRALTPKQADTLDNIWNKATDKG